jgi:Restriction alleviation protein Lar
MSDELKPCPCCGGTAYVSEGYTTNEGAWPHGTFYRVYCGSCQLRQLFHRTALAATTAWNRRTASTREKDAAGWLHIDEVKQLCNDFSSRIGNVYIKDVEAALDQIAAQPLLAVEALRAIIFARDSGQEPALILDENSPLMDAARAILAAKEKK